MTDVPDIDDSLEEWKPVNGFEGIYEVSNLGRIRSLDRVIMRSNKRRHTISGRIMTPTPVKSGHLHLILSKAGAVQTVQVHWIVAEAFIGERPKGMEIRHLNGNPSDNRVQNLKYGTRSENQLDRVAHGNHNHANKTHCGRGHLLMVPNLVRSTWEKHGYRGCLACDRAGSYVRKYKELRPQWGQLADKYYEKIMKDVSDD